MKKQLLFLSILFCGFLAPNMLLGQGNTCSNATPFCTKPGHTFTYANQTGESSTTTHSGASYGCMGYTPNQSWFYLESTGGGKLTYTISQGSTIGGTNEDVDFVCWGPYTAASFATACSHLNGSCSGGTYNTTPNPGCTGGIIDCSYSTNGVETCTIPASINNAAGLFYIIDVTNYSDNAGYISITAGASNLPTNCAIACPSSMTMLMDDYTTFNGASWASNSGNVNNGATLACNKTYAIWPSMPVTLTDPFSDLLTPCVLVDFSPLTNSLTTHGSYTLSDGSTAGVVTTGQIGSGYAQGTDAQTYWFFTDSALGQTLTYCQNGKVYNSTYTPVLTLQNCWDNTVLAGPQTLSAAGSTCYTLSIPGGTNMGDAYYTISPASGAPGITDTDAGWAIIDPSQLPSSTTYTVTYHFKGSESCNMITGTFVFTTPSGPTLTVTPTSTTICTGSSTTLVASGTSNTYTWSTSATTSSITVSPTNTTTPTVYTVTGTKTSTGCKSTATATVTVGPLPTVTITASPTSVCLGSASSFTASGASTYTWTSSANGGLTGSGANVTATPTSTVSPTYTVNATDANGCKNKASITLTVNPLPVISVTPGNTVICSGVGSSTLTAGGASTYTWAAGATLSATTGSVVVASPTNTAAPTIYTVTGTDANSCVNTKTVSITVNPTPTIGISGGGANSQTVCGGGSANAIVNAITFTSNPSGAFTWTNSNTALGGNLSIASGNGNIAAYSAPTVTAQTIGVITASATATGCTSNSSSQLTYTVIINPIPGETGGVITPAGCGLSDGTIIGAAGTGGSTYSYEWNNAGGFVAGSAYTNAAGTYPLQIKDNTTGCIFTKNFTIPNAGAPTAGTPVASATAVCVGGTVVLTEPTIAGTTYNWTEANGTTGTGDTYTVTNIPGSPNPYTIGVTATSAGCTGSQATTNITINPLPITPILVSPTGPNNSYCEGSPTPLVVNTGTNTAVWYSNNTVVHTGSSFTPPTATYPAGTYTFSVIDSVAAVNGCINAPQLANTVTLTLVVNPLPTPPVLTAPTGTNNSYCEGSPAPLTVNTGTNIAVWYSGNTVVYTGSSFTPPTANYPAGTYTFSVIDSIPAVNGCVNASQSANTVTLTLVVNPLPIIPVLTAPTGTDNSYCEGSPVPLTVNTGTNIAVWYNNNTVVNVGSSFTPSTTNFPAGTYTFSVIDSIPAVNGCINAPQSANTVTLTLVVNPLPTIPILTAPTGTNNSYCEGSPAPLTVNTGTNLAVWYNNNTVVNVGSSFTPSTTDFPAGTYTFSVIDSIPAVNGCINAPQSANTVTLTLVVNPLPTIPILTAPTGTSNSYCEGSPAPLTVNTGTNLAVWYSNNTVVHTGSSFTPPTATYPAGTYTFSVIDSIPAVNGCINAPQSANTVTLTLVVNPTPPPPIFSGTTTANGNAYCQGSPSPLTVNSGTTIAVWYSGGVVVNVGPSFTPPANLPAGTYTYSVIDSIPLAQGGCTNASQSTNTFTLSLIVNPIPGPPTYTGTTSANGNSYCQGTPAPLTVNSGMAIAVWYYNGTVVYVGSSFTPPATYTAGTYVFSLIDSIPLAQGGCTSGLPSANSFTVGLTVNPTPSVNLLNGVSVDSARCGQNTGGVEGISNSSVSGGTQPYNFQWYNNGQLMPGQTSPILSSQGIGTYSLQITDANGCIANVTAGSSTFTVPASAAIHAQATTSPSPAVGSVPLAVTFSNTSTGATNYTWSFGDGNSSTATNPINTYTTAGTFNVILAAINGTCSDTFRLTVIAHIPTTIIIPNVFTPNGDGINDEFFIINTGMVSLNCEIFNRWGQLLHTITAPDQGWDGVVPNGDKAPDGTYMYILQAQGLDGKTYKQQGTVTLIR